MAPAPQCVIFEDRAVTSAKKIPYPWLLHLFRSQRGDPSSSSCNLYIKDDLIISITGKGINYSKSSSSSSPVLPKSNFRFLPGIPLPPPNPTPAFFLNTSKSRPASSPALKPDVDQEDGYGIMLHMHSLLHDGIQIQETQSRVIES